MNDRPTDVEGIVVDSTKLAGLAGIPVTSPLLAVTLADGRFAIICTEGVGWYEEEDHGIFVPNDYDGVTIPAEQVKQCLTEERQSLASFVRVFGGRLESNFWLWYRAIKG